MDSMPLQGEAMPQQAFDPEVYDLASILVGMKHRNTTPETTANLTVMTAAAIAERRSLSEGAMGSDDSIQDELEAPQEEEVQPVADAEPRASVKEPVDGSPPPELANNSEKKEGEERPYACKHCDKTYKRNDHLLRHQKSAHENFSLQCSICHKPFTRQDNLNQHMKSIHGLKLPDADPPGKKSGPRPAAVAPAPPPGLIAKRPTAVNPLPANPKRLRDQEDEGRDVADPSTPEVKKPRTPLPTSRPTKNPTVTRVMVDQAQAEGVPMSASPSQESQAPAKPRTPLPTGRPAKNPTASQAKTRHAPGRPKQTQGSQAPAAASGSTPSVGHPPSSNSATPSGHLPAERPTPSPWALAALDRQALAVPREVQGHAQSGEAPGSIDNPPTSSSGPSSGHVGGGKFTPINKR